MKNSSFPLMITICIFLLMVPGTLSQTDSDSSDVSVDVDRKCQTTAYRFRFESGIKDDGGYPLIGTGGTGEFKFLPTNLGEMSFVNENISIYRLNQTTNSKGEFMEVSNQTANGTTSFVDSYLFNSTNMNGQIDNSLLREDEPIFRAPYWHNRSFDNWTESRPEGEEKEVEFVATPNFTDAVYRSELKLSYRCEFGVQSDTTVTNATSDNSYSFQNFNPSNYDSSDIVNHILVDGLNISVLNKDENYARTVQKVFRDQFDFKVVTVEGNGSTPEEVSDTNEEVGRNLETDADEVSNLSKNSSIDTDVNQSTNSSRDTNANTTSNLTRNSSLESDAERDTDSSPVPGDNAQPGETEVPEPQPQPTPDPVPLLSVTMRPLNSTYDATRGEFTEIGLEITNTGEETISDLQMEPRFSEDMPWESQDVSIDSLEVNQSMNRSVYVNPDASVDPGMYQIPVFASNPDEDIGSQFVNVEVTEEPVSISALNISEAPQDIRFEANNNYTVPVLLRNAGDEDLQNVDIELQNTENCGDYTAETVERIAAGETASVSVSFNASEQLNECEATIVASSDSGSFAFSEMTVQTVQEKGIVPQEFRVPIVASLWTVMLVIYTVVTKKYGLNSLTVKIPLIILVAGEAFILIYLSSAYYNVIPPGVLPFEAAAS